MVFGKANSKLLSPIESSVIHKPLPCCLSAVVTDAGNYLYMADEVAVLLDSLQTFAYCQPCIKPGAHTFNAN